MAELEERLRNLSTHFNHPDKAYAFLSHAEEKVLVEIETQLAVLQGNTGEAIKNKFSVQLLVDYFAEGISLNDKPALPIMNSNYYSQTAGNGSKMVSKFKLKEINDEDIYIKR